MRSISTFVILCPNKVKVNQPLKHFFFFRYFLFLTCWFSPTDLIAIPDFQVGAMENWGLTTYRETSLLVDPPTSSISDKLWVTMVIGHEIAHQVRLWCCVCTPKPYMQEVIIVLRVLMWFACSGSATWWPWSGGMIFGWMKDLPNTWSLFQWRPRTPNSEWYVLCWILEWT